MEGTSGHWGPDWICNLFETSIFAAVTLLMSRFDTVTIAAHQAALNFASTLYMLPVSICMALTILVGFENGAGRLKDARQYNLLGIGELLAFPDYSDHFAGFRRADCENLFQRTGSNYTNTAFSNLCNFLSNFRCHSYADTRGTAWIQGCQSCVDHYLCVLLDYRSARWLFHSNLYFTWGIWILDWSHCRARSGSHCAVVETVPGAKASFPARVSKLRSPRMLFFT